MTVTFRRRRGGWTYNFTAKKGSMLYFGCIKIDELSIGGKTISIIAPTLGAQEKEAIKEEFLRRV